MIKWLITHRLLAGCVCVFIGSHLTQVNSIIEPLTVVHYRITSWSHDESYLRWKCSTGKGWKCKSKFQWLVFFFFCVDDLWTRRCMNEIWRRPLRFPYSIMQTGWTTSRPPVEVRCVFFNCVRFLGFFILNISFQFPQQMLWFSFLQMKTQILLRCTSRTAVWTVQFLVYFFFVVVV